MPSVMMALFPLQKIDTRLQIRQNDNNGGHYTYGNISSKSPDNL